LLITLAVLMLFQAADLFTFGQTWPVLLVVAGGLLLVERLLPGSAGFVPAPFDSRYAPAWTGATPAEAATGPASAVITPTETSGSSYEPEKGGR
jgi:hypothetical protein